VLPQNNLQSTPHEVGSIMPKKEITGYLKLKIPDAFIDTRKFKHSVKTFIETKELY
jgi:hypothetical protein